jgi:hypothetical protein
MAEGARDASLLEERRVRRIEIFGLAFAEHAAAERDDAPLPVADREDDAPTKIVEAFAFLRAPGESAFDELRFGEALGEGAQQTVAPVGRKSETEAPHGGEIDAATFEIEPRVAPRHGVQLLFEEGARRFHRRLKGRLALDLLAVLGALRRHLETGLARQRLDRLGEGHALGLHGEADDVAMHAAAEAVIEGLVLDDAEGRRLFLVEGAEADIFAPAPDEPDAAPNHLRQRDSRAQLVEEPGWKGHRSRQLSAVSHQLWRAAGNNSIARCYSIGRASERQGTAMTLKAHPSSRFTTWLALAPSICPA